MHGSGPAVQSAKRLGLPKPLTRVQTPLNFKEIYGLKVPAAV